VRPLFLWDFFDSLIDDKNPPIAMYFALIDDRKELIVDTDPWKYKYGE
jgi:hypothetical protein